MSITAAEISTDEQAVDEVNDVSAELEDFETYLDGDQYQDALSTVKDAIEVLGAVRDYLEKHAEE